MRQTCRQKYSVRAGDQHGPVLRCRVIRIKVFTGRAVIKAEEYTACNTKRGDKTLSTKSLVAARRVKYMKHASNNGNIQQEASGYLRRLFR